MLSAQEMLAFLSGIEPPYVQKKMMDLSDNMGAYKTSSTIDFVEGRPLEIHNLITKPVERARLLGMPVPHLETLVTQIESVQRLRY